jgi:hypothetical protein
MVIETVNVGREITISTCISICEVAIVSISSYCDEIPESRDK